MTPSDSAWKQGILAEGAAESRPLWAIAQQHQQP
jgi:hypothetical protein